jgi:two-component system chemotaxis response regulator CheB
LVAASTVLAGLPGTFLVPLLLVQHSRGSDDLNRLSRLLQKVTTLPVRTAQSGVCVRDLGVTVVPGGFTATFDHQHQLTLTAGSGHKGGDVLLTSVAAALGPAALAVVLTGMLHDGTQGVRAIKHHGGYVLAQDPATARAPSMPSSAIATGCVDLIVPLDRIADALTTLTMTPHE